MPTHNSASFQVKGQVRPGQQQIPQLSPGLLAHNGPIIQVQIEVPSALAQSLQRANTAIPNPIDGFALIDTGASITSVDVTVFAQLGVNPNGIANVGTAGGPQQQSTYPARLLFPGTTLPSTDHARTLGCNLTGQTVLGGKKIIALVGRDLLSRCVFIYNGSAGMWSLSI
jgi:hypothetical protein